MRVVARADRVERDLHAAVRAVLETDRHREARGQLAVHLALRSPRTDRPPGNEISHELRRDRIEELGARRKSELVDVEQEAPRAAQALVDGEAVVEIGVVDQPLPTHGGARLLEVDPHHDEQVVAVVTDDAAQAPRIVERCLGVVNRAGSHDDDETIVGTGQDVRDGLAAVRHLGRRRLVHGDLFHQDRRGEQRTEVLDA